MKPTTGITLPASFVVTVSHAGAEIVPTAPPDQDILTVAEVAGKRPYFDIDFGFTVKNASSGCGSRRAIAPEQR